MNFDNLQTCGSELKKLENHNFAKNDSPENSLVEDFDFGLRRHTFSLYFMAAIKFIIKMRKSFGNIQQKSKQLQIQQI
ncbi:unnamed protein product (macronuclear) [Paramecium tetraurelia]|uniref:Uncharacterized protein n=1 Tax=Paramecium tetraurelia TaxID=5888 RepID=A0C3L9_PARTE|nr:uncharacterized protein GSPATT00034865001 [Paramecium tetraurelia]CAK65386.1 unnamed protein product [Paramecium tetraurelia]|eukprot:XP_001432783.1 hypothetical protein (macronuclear) [Paramecium tetraurelia strain d4-2]